jgi:hypothetical protein
VPGRALSERALKLYHSVPFIVATAEELAILITHSEVDEAQTRSIVPYLLARWQGGNPETE